MTDDEMKRRIEELLRQLQQSRPRNSRYPGLIREAAEQVNPEQFEAALAAKAFALSEGHSIPPNVVMKREIEEIHDMVHDLADRLSLLVYIVMNSGPALDAPDMEQDLKDLRAVQKAISTNAITFVETAYEFCGIYHALVTETDLPTRKDDFEKFMRNINPDPSKEN
jgi:hypothetical protein